VKNSKLISFLLLLSLLSMPNAYAIDAHRAVKIIKPVHKAVVSNTVEICMEAYGLEVEQSSNGVNEGKGHHHVMIDIFAPAFYEIDKPIKLDSRFIHLKDGSSCVKLNLPTGRHFIRTLFARGNNIPYSPLISDTIIVFVE
jgi:hypothetical protein